jgi:hypothetical protein
VVEEATTLVEQPSINQAESTQVEDVVTAAQNPAASVAAVLDVQDTVLVMVLASSPSSSLEVNVG